MGKKSLIKSTTKKKTSSPKKSASKQSAASTGAPKSGEKKAVNPKKPAAPKATPQPSRKKMPISELLKLSFGTWAPDKLYAPTADSETAPNYTAPPFSDGAAEEIKKIKSLLARQFDLTTPPAPPEQAEEEAPASKIEPAAANSAPPEPETAPEPPREPVPVAELLKLSFGTWAPDKLYAPTADLKSIANYSAPPFFDAANEELTALKGLLARQFDLTAPPVSPESVNEVKAPEADTAPAVEDIPETAESGAATAPEKTPESPETPVADATPAAAADKAPTEIPVAEKSKTPAESMEEETPSPTASGPVTTPETVPEPAPVPQEPPSTPAAGIVSPPEPEKASPPASEPPAAPVWNPPPPACAAPPDKKEPPNNALRLLVGCLGVIFGLLLIASALNSSNYYLKPTAAGLEIWRGKFSPKGKTLVEAIPGVALSVPVTSGYNRNQAMTVIFDHYMSQADQRAGVIGEPDFAAVAGLYEQAKKYAPTPAQVGMADNRLRTIKARALIADADKAMAEKTPRNIEKALALLYEAAELAADRTQQQLIRIKIDELAAMTAETAGPGKQTEKTPAATGKRKR